MNEDIKVTFIIPSDCRDENDCSEDMLLAFTACEQHCGGGLHAQWVHEKQWSKFDSLNRKDVFVLTEFDGELYEKLRKTKCLLVGPRCLSCCLTEGTPIPSGPEPVYTVAMRGLVITASGLNKQKKIHEYLGVPFVEDEILRHGERYKKCLAIHPNPLIDKLLHPPNTDNIKKKVQWMGGIYSTVLTDDTTHLISDTVLSDKYIKSVEKGIPIMDESWLEAVWEASLRLNVSAASTDFNFHRLKPFTNLQVTTSGISKKEKQAIMKLVSENGGEFSGAFQSETTDVVVLTKEGMGSEKYKAALEYGKACVLPAWVRESAARGAALPFSRYRVAGASTSSPLAEHRLPDMSLNFSRITAVRPPSNFVDETKSDLSTMSGKMKLSQLSQELKRSNDMSADDKEVIEELENFDMSLIKKAGPIFDGFCIWVSGLEGVSRERAAALVSRCGGVRHDGPHARVTHAVVGARRGAGAVAAQRALPAVPVLHVRWLTDSVRAGRALDEARYLVELSPATPVKAAARAPPPEAASPMSKRNLALLRHGPLDLPAPEQSPAYELAPALELPAELHHDEIVNHYLSQHLSQEQRAQSPQPQAPDASSRLEQPEVTDDMEDEPTEEVEQIFRDMKIEVQGLDEDAITELGAEVSAAGGALVAAGAGGQYALVPLDFDPADLLTPTAEPVTVFWLKDCLSQQELLPVQYYHRPVSVAARAAPGGGPLRGVVASLSTYSGVERAFLDELAKLLGATTQLRFCRRNTANALASTHLICPTPAGDKYAGAVKWGLPAVRASWLLACAAGGRRVGERPHLVGDTTAPPSPEPQTMEPEPAAQDPEITHDESVELKGLESAMPPPADACAPRRSSAPGREHTPKGKVAADGEGEMSPASRYIAMARQGLLGGDSQDTPRRDRDPPAGSAAALEGEAVRTPPLDDALSTPNLRGLSPRTRRRLQAVRRGEMPSDPVRTPTDPFEKNPPTPDSAFGGALRPGAGRMSPDARKRLWAVVHQLPGKQPAHTPRGHTPLSEIRNRFLAQFHGDGAAPPAGATPPAGQAPAAAPRKLHLQDEADTPPPKMAKLSENQCAGGATIDDYSDSSDSALHKSDGDADPSKSASSGSSALPAEVDAQLQRLNAALTGKVPLQRRRTLRESVSAAPVAESEPAPESQPNTVGWDDTTPTPAVTPTVTPAVAAAVAPAAAPCATQTSPVKLDPTRLIKRFMLSSNVDNREEIIEMIVHLGGEVCEGGELDPAATHLLCAAPGRSEKMLGSVAAGRWVLHPAYVARSRAAGAFLPEEEYEWGNPAAVCLPAVSGGERALARAAHRWRAARAGGAPGPFAGVSALLHVPAPRRRLLARLVEAGGGRAPDIQPPYNDESVTVCFADLKRHPLSERDAAWLAARRVPVCAPVLLSAYLTDDVTPNPEEHCLPDYRYT